MNLDPLLDSLRTARAALQAEIDTLADQAAALDRAIAALDSTADVVVVDVSTFVNPAKTVTVIDGKANVDGKLPARKKAATSGRKVDHEHWSAVAAWIVAAKADGGYTLPALAKRFGVTLSTAKNWPGKCRELGYDIDHTPNTAPPEPTPDPVDNARRAFSPDDATQLLEAM